MPTVNLPYVDVELDLTEQGEQNFWRHFHWGYYVDPGTADDSPEGYLVATEAMTEHMLTVAGVADGHKILDVGCGFGGTLDLIRGRNNACQLYGLNIDHRQVARGTQLLAEYGHAEGVPVSFIAADACRLPLPGDTFDHLLAVECIFHFPSRKSFFREAARALKPGGTLTLSDFLAAPGALPAIVAKMGEVGIGDGTWYGRLSKPFTVKNYERVSRAVGLELVVNDDITAQTLPTYPALRRLNQGIVDQQVLDDESQVAQGIDTVNALEELAGERHLCYHVLTFRKPM
jgi:SAM-dependent methyltransferase